MDTCVIFCAGECITPAFPINSTDFLLAADGGLQHLQRLGLTPDGIIGDFDSLGYIPRDAQIFPVEKDDTDAMLAVRQGLSMGCRKFFLYGSLDGPRLDHTVANFQTLQFLADRGAVGYLIGERYIVTVLKNGSMRMPADATGIVSVFCMGTDAHGVTLTGLKYTLEKGTLSAGFPLGVSNHFIGEEAVFSVEDGSLLILYDRCNGFPRRA